MTVLVPLRDNRTAFPDDCQTLTLAEYLKMAEKCIRYLTDSHQSERLLSDEDAIAYIAERLATADSMYEEGRGAIRGTLRMKYAKWGIMNYYKYRDKSRRNNVKLFRICEEDNRQVFYLPNTNESEDSQSRILRRIKRLAKRDVDILAAHNYYCGGKPMKELAKEMKVTKQAISLRIKRGLTKLKEKLEGERLIA